MISLFWCVTFSTLMLLSASRVGISRMWFPSRLMLRMTFGDGTEKSSIRSILFFTMFSSSTSDMPEILWDGIFVRSMEFWFLLLPRPPRQPNWDQRLNQGDMELWNSNAVGKCQGALSGESRYPGTPYLEPRAKVQTFYLVPCLGDALGAVGIWISDGQC